MKSSNRQIYLLRHPKTAQCGYKRFVGQLDVPLDEHGIDEARMLCRYFIKQDISHVFSSDLQRTVIPAEIIAEAVGCGHTRLEGFNELALGAWEGESIEYIAQTYPKEYYERGNDLIHYRISGGENYIDLQKRAFETFLDCLNGQEGNVLFVSHSAVNKTLLAKITGQPIEAASAIAQDYSAVNIIREHHGIFTVIETNLQTL